MMIYVVPFWESLVGLMLFGFFAFTFFLLLAVYISFAFDARKTPEFKESLFRVWLLFLVFIWMSILTVPRFFEFTTVITNADGSWKIKNGFGITFHTFKPDEPRKVTMYTRDVFWSGGSARNFKNATIYIVTDKKVYRSWTEGPTVIEQAYNRLLDEREKFGDRIPVAENNSSPIGFEENLQKLKYVVYALLGSSLFISWVLEKIKKN